MRDANTHNSPDPKACFQGQGQEFRLPIPQIRSSVVLGHPSVLDVDPGCAMAITNERRGDGTFVVVIQVLNEVGRVFC